MIASNATDLATAAAIVIGSLGTAVAAVVSAFYAARAARNTTTPAGTPALGELGANVAAAVTTPPGEPSLGQVATDNAALLEHVHEKVCGP